MVKRNLGLRFTVEDNGFEKLIRQQEAKEEKDRSKSAVLLVRKCPYCKTGNLIRKQRNPTHSFTGWQCPVFVKGFFAINFDSFPVSFPQDKGGYCHTSSKT